LSNKYVYTSKIIHIIINLVALVILKKTEHFPVPHRNLPYIFVQTTLKNVTY